MKKHGVKGFTLIELLVVIAIICTRATMLFPVVSSMQERGRQSVCLNNIRQIALQHLLYADANGGLFCPAWDTEKKQWDASADYRSAGILAQSISAADRGSGEIFACPETKFKLTQKKSYAPQYAGYGYNYLLSFANVNARPPNYRFVSTAKVTACGGIGGGAKNALADADILVYGGVSGNADEAAKALLNGTLQFNPNVTCNHHSHEDGHSCGSGHSCH